MSPRVGQGLKTPPKFPLWPLMGPAARSQCPGGGSSEQAFWDTKAGMGGALGRDSMLSSDLALQVCYNA